MAEDRTIRATRDDYSHSTPAGRDDPLAELARLIGQNEEFERLGQQRMRRADPPLTGANADPYYAEPQAYADPAYPEPQAGGQRYDYDSYPDEARYEPRAQGQAAQTGYEADPYAAPYAAGGYDDPRYQAGQQAAGYDNYEYPEQGYAQAGAGQQDYYAQPGEAGGYAADDAYGSDPRFVADGHMPPHAEEVYQDAPAPKARGGLITVMAVLGLAVVSVGGVFAYRAFSKSTPSNPPIIKAEPGPAKLPASQQSKDDAAANKLIYDRVGEKAGGEKVVPREEQPVDVAKTTPRVVFPGGPTPLPNAQPPISQMAPAPVQAPTPPAAPAPVAAAVPTPSPAPGEPKKVRTETIRASTANDPARPAPRVAARPVPSEGGPMEITPAAVAAAKPQRTPSAPAATPAPVSTASTQGGYMVQVSSQRSEADAQTSFRNTQSKYPGSVSGSAIIKRADLGEKGVYYRAGFGPFGSREEAISACERLKGQGGSCVVQKI